MDWPDVQLPSGLDETTEDPSISTEFGTGIVQTRARYTRMRRTWELSWANMRGVDYRALRAFYELARGGSLPFNWTHPKDRRIYNVRFKGDLKSSATATQMGCMSVKATLEQV